MHTVLGILLVSLDFVSGSSVRAWTYSLPADARFGSPSPAEVTASLRGERTVRRALGFTTLLALLTVSWGLVVGLE